MLDTHFATQSHGAGPRGREGGGEAMRVVRASHLGMCFGVREAIAKVLRAASREPLTVLGDLVHNETVLERLAARGVRVCREVDEVETPGVAITAHGVSDRRRAAVRARGLTVLDATCPIVKAAHRAVRALERDGFHPVIVGTPNHVEVRGLTEDLAEFDVVSSEEDVEALRRHPVSGSPRKRHSRSSGCGTSCRCCAGDSRSPRSRWRRPCACRRGCGRRRRRCWPRRATSRSWSAAPGAITRASSPPRAGATAGVSSSFRTPAICGPSGSRARGQPASLRARPRRTM